MRSLLASFGRIEQIERVNVCFFFRVGGVLIPTRSFGDFLLKSEHEKPAWKQVISAVPQIQCFKLDAQWEFVVVGSDGVWDAMSNQVTIWPLLKARAKLKLFKMTR